MNRRIMNSILAKKHKRWCESIEDTTARKLVQANTIITGGCIASMLLKEKVNDYDVYFTDLETTEAVARYYVTKFNELHQSDSDKTGKPYVTVENGRVLVNVKSAGATGENTDDSQYQYFEGQPLEEGENYVEENLIQADDLDGEMLPDEQKSRFRPVFCTSNAITLSDKIQIVIRFYGDHEKIHENYDFIHCTNYWTTATGVVLKSAAMESLLTKNLQYVGSKYPLCSIIRLRKFIRRGFHINAGQMLKMMMQVSALDLTDIKVLEDQLVGVDSAYFIQLIAALKKKQEADDSFEVTQPYVASLVDRIFGS